jgi:NodT family efflux transporter outer membrane factor (OMF) lipoprotein
MSRHARSVGALATVVIAALSGCAVGPNYKRPPVITPEAYKELDGWKVAEPGDLTLRGAWWELFGDPTLNELESRVSAANQTLAAAEATYRQATALVREARAGFFPTVTIGAGYTRSQVSSTITSSGTNANATAAALTGGVATSTTGRPTNFFQLPIDVTWTPDFWGRVRRTVESNQGNAQASAGDLDTARLSLQAELAQDYFQMRTLDAQRKLLDETVKAFEQSLELTRTRFRGGVASQVDVVQAETQLETTRAQAIDVGVQRAQLEHAIAVIIGQPPSALTLPAVPLTAPPPVVPIGIPSQLLERRPDIAAAERRMAAANAQIGVALAAFYPTVTLSASGGFESSSIARWLTWPSRFFAVGPSIQQTVFDGGLRRAQTDQARAAYDTGVANYRETVLTAFQGVEDNLAALRILESEADVQERAVRAARRSVALTTTQYRAGVVSYLNVITTQTIALANEVTAVQVLGRRMTATVLLVQALGGGWNTAELPSAAAVTERTRER